MGRAFYGSSDGLLGSVVNAVDTMKLTKLTKLSSEQERTLVEFRARWFAIGSSTEPADRPRAEKTISAMYARVGKPAPKFLWTQSPATACLAMAVIRELPNASLVDSLLDSLRNSLVDSLRALLRDSLGALLQYSLWDSLVVSLWDSLGVSLWDSLVDTRGDTLVVSRFCGSNEAYWIAYYRFIEEELHVRYDPQDSEDLMLWSEVTKSCGWWLPYEGLCVIADRPESVTLETNRDPPRIHNAKGPALRYRDGYEVYCWHGVRVSARVINSPESFTREELKAERNSEIHRCLAERLGWERYLEIRGVTMVDAWTCPNTGLQYQLLEAVQRSGELEPRYLKMQSPPLHDGSQPYFIEPVDPGLNSAQAARKWQIRLSSDPGARYYRHGDIVVTYAPRVSLYWPSVDECNTNSQLEFVQEA